MHVPDREFCVTVLFEEKFKTILVSEGQYGQTWHLRRTWRGYFEDNIFFKKSVMLQHINAAEHFASFLPAIIVVWRSSQSTQGHSERF